jgi:hypothetical protein
MRIQRTIQQHGLEEKRPVFPQKGLSEPSEVPDSPAGLRQGNHGQEVVSNGFVGNVSGSGHLCIHGIAPFGV